MRIIYSPKARDDLKEIKDYISNELSNSSAALRITNKIVKDCSNLKENPFLGAELKNKFDVNSDMRYLISSNYFIFYQVKGSDIRVFRVIDGRTNYMQHLFDI